MPFVTISRMYGSGGSEIAELVAKTLGWTLYDEEIVETTRSIIEEAVKKGPAVLVGRGAQCLLAERADGLHVFCHAPTAALINYAVTKLGVPPGEAEKKVHDTNKQREQYVQRH